MKKIIWGNNKIFWDTREKIIWIKYHPNVPAAATPLPIITKYVPELS